MISTEVEARATLPTYMTYPDTWRTKQQPPEFLRPAPKPISQFRYNGLSSSFINGLATHHAPSQQVSPPCSNNRPAPPSQCLPPSSAAIPSPANLPPTPSPSPSTPTTPLSIANTGTPTSLRTNKFSPPILVNNNTNRNGNRSNSSSPVNLSGKGLIGDEMVPPQMTAEDLQYTAYRIFAPSFIPGAYNANPYAVYAAAAAAAASSPYALLPPHHPATPRSAPYIPTVTTIAPPLSPLIDQSYHLSTTTANNNVVLSIGSIHPGPGSGGGSITSGTSGKLAGGSITSGTSILRERRPPGVATATGVGGFKIPSGKEGSLKHRILQTRPDEVLDLQQKEGPVRKRLSPPPPTLAPPTLTHQPHLPYPPLQSKQHHTHYQTISPPPATTTPIATPVTNGMPAVKQPLITGGSFTRGTFIQLGGGELRRVEDMRTEDFIQSAERSPGLRLAESTVVKIVENRGTGGATVTLSYNERRTQVTQIEVESSWEHPYFVMGASWASCKPELTYQYYGLRVSRLQVGDVLVSLTPREPQPFTLIPTTTPVNIDPQRSSLTPPLTTSNVNSYNSHFRSPTSSHQMAYQHHAQAQAHTALMQRSTNSCTITTATGTAMTARPVTYTVRPGAAHAQHQLPVAVVPNGGGGGRIARSMSPDSLARKRRWSAPAPDQLSDDEQQPINRRSKTE